MAKKQTKVPQTKTTRAVLRLHRTDTPGGGEHTIVPYLSVTTAKVVRTFNLTQEQLGLLLLRESVDVVMEQRDRVGGDDLYTSSLPKKKVKKGAKSFDLDTDKLVNKAVTKGVKKAKRERAEAQTRAIKTAGSKVVDIRTKAKKTKIDNVLTAMAPKPKKTKK